jgi:SHS2 domain-containing protein
MAPFTVIDHTADIAVTIEAVNEEELLQEGIRAIFYLLTESNLIRSSGTAPRNVKKKRIKIDFVSFEELFIDFLNRVLFLVDTAGLLPVGVVTKIGKSRAVMVVHFIPISCGPGKFCVTREIKAATHHNYRVVKRANSLKTVVTFDV